MTPDGHLPHEFWGPMDERERFQRLLAVLQELSEEDGERPIIVEGRKDVECLSGLGLGGPILQVNNGVPLLDFCEALAAEHRDVILLLDWDRTGEILLANLRRILSTLGVHTDTTYRSALRRWANAQLKDIESLYPYVTRGRMKFGL